MSDEREKKPSAMLGKRIMIIGSGGAGKSTLARRLGSLLGLDVVHLDSHHWQSGWQAPSREQWRQKVRMLVAGESWIIDGNYGNSIDIRLERADTVVFLDLPKWPCLWGVICRRLKHRGGRTRLDMAEGCPEQLDWDFLKWIYNFQRDSRPRLIEAIGSCCPQQQVVMLRTRRQIDVFVQELAANDARALSLVRADPPAGCD
ncbi:MAG: AAA family ATPase [Phycisphaerae bacterium]|jgi:adenylate kinase family enzyme